MTLTLPATGTVGAPLSVQAAADNLTNPVYQLWVESPGGIWQSSGGYSHAPDYTVTPQAVGNYQVIVYAKDPYAPSTSAFAVTAQAMVNVSS